MSKILYEVKLYIFLISISCLLLVIREEVSPIVLSTYFLASIFGIKTISCLITGKCYSEVYYFLIGYAIINILFVFYYREMEKYFPNLLKDVKDKYKKKSVYSNLKDNLIYLNNNFKKQFNRDK